MAERKTATKAKTAAKPKAKATPKAAAKAKAGAKAGRGSRSKAAPKSSAKSAAKSAPRPAAKAGSKTNAGAQAKPSAAAGPRDKAKPAPKGGKRLSRKELEEARRLIMAERTRIIRELGRIEETINDATQGNEGSNQSYSNHLADIGTDYMEQEKNFYYASQEGHYLRALDEALERIERGEYGLCELCSAPIGDKRLKAVPSARLCIQCKSESEKGQRGR